MAFALGAFPFFVAVLALQNAMYGGPLSSGYGSFSQLFSLDHLGPNLARYPRWLVETETPFILVALAAPFVSRSPESRRAVWGLLAFALTVVACYLPYQVFDAWWFLRFLLPAYPALFVLASAGATTAVARLAPAPRFAALVLLAAALGGSRLAIADDRAVFELRDLERRFRDGGEYVARKLPPNAVVFTTQQSGSVRFYSGRPTIIWDMLDAAWLDRAVEHYQRRGLRPFFLFEQEEDRGFRARFESSGRFGGLEWPPAALIGRQIKIFDPLDYERFRRGEKIETDYVVSGKE